MKKLVLNLGLATLTVLPIVAVASCSATTPETPSITTEVNKYKNPFAVKDSAKTVTVAAAIESINKGTNEEKIAELQKLVTLQLDNQNFTYLVEKAVAGTGDQSVDVTMKITEKASSAKSETVKIVINGLAKAESPLQAEAARFKISVEANTESKKLDAKAIVEKITTATGEAKLTTLKGIATIPEPSSGFTIQVLSAKVATEPTSVEVTIEVLQTGTENKAEATLTITGFKKQVEVEAEKLNVSVQAKNQSGTTRQIIFGINETAKTPEEKLTALKAIVDLPELTSGFAIEVGMATQDSSTNTSVNVALTVVQTGTQNKANATFTITGLAAETLQEEVNRLATSNLVNGTVLPAKAGETAQQASDAITSLESLGQYYNLLPLPDGLVYVYTSNTVEMDTVKVTAAVTSSESGITPASKEFVISGFKTAALVALENEAKSKLGNRQVLATKNMETAAKAQATIKGDGQLNLYYANTTLTSGYGYTFSKSEVDKTTPTILNVTLRVRTTNNSLSIFHVVQISGFQNPTPIEQEALKFQTSLSIKTPGTLTTGVISVINAIEDNQVTKLAALQGYVENFPTVGEAYTLSIGSAVADSTTPTSVNIPITISPKPTNPVGRNVVSQSPVTVIFTITGLTVGTPEQQLETIATLLNNRTVLSNKASETAAAAQAAINSDSRLNQYYKNTPLPSEFSYNYGDKSEVNKQTPTTLDVTLKISIRGTNHIIFKVVQISGFTALTDFEKEAQKFAISSPAKIATTLTSEVIQTITNQTEQTNKLEALKTFAELPETAGYTIVINTPIVDPTKNTSVIVPMTISKPAAEGGQAPTPVSVNFIITGLAVPSASQ